MTRKPRPIRIEGDVAYVPLTKGYEAVIDAADVPLVEGIFWRAVVHRRADGSVKSVYARCSSRCSNGQKTTVLMHRFLAGSQRSDSVDHRDTNGLNNRRSNLRAATVQQNNCNRKARYNSASGAKGVAISRNKWRARIGVDGRLLSLGTFASKGDAEKAYAAASARLHGDFGRLA